jgi:hypothetical protein
MTCDMQETPGRFRLRDERRMRPAGTRTQRGMMGATLTRLEYLPVDGEATS